MSAAIRKSDLQKIIREEYVRVLLENSGHRVTEARVRLIAEKIETGELNERDFLDLAKGVFGFGKEKAVAAGQAAAAKGKELYGKAAEKAGEVKKDIQARADAARAQRAEKNPAVKGAVENQLSTLMSKSDEKWTEEQSKIMMTAKDLLKKNGYVVSLDDKGKENVDEYSTEGNALYAAARKALGAPPAPMPGSSSAPPGQQTPAQRGEPSGGVRNVPAAAGNVGRG